MAAPITYTPVGDLLIDQLVEPPPQPGPFRRGLKTGVADLKSIGGGVLQYAGRGLGAKPLEDYGAGIVESAAAESAPYRMQVEDVGTAFGQGVGPGLGAAADLVKYTVGNQLPMLATTVAGGVGGRLAAGALGATRAAAGVGAAEKAAAVAKTAAGVATPGEAAIASAVKAADIGAGLGLGASAVGMELGQIAPEGLKPENNASMLQMATGALAAGVLDTMVPVYLARQMGLMGVAQRALTPRAAGIGAVAKDVGVGAAKVGAFEAGQETAQSVIERASANQPLSGPEAGSDYLNSGVMGAIMGVLTGGIAGGVNSMQRPVAGAEPVVAPPTEPEAPAGPVEPAPAPPTPEAMHADLVAQHAAATEQLTSLGQAVTQAQQQHDALVAARAELDNESKLEPGQRRTKSELTVAKKAATAQIKAARAQIEELGGQVFAARNMVDALTPQIETARQALTPQGDTNGLQIEGQAPAQEVTPLTFPTIDYPGTPTPYERTGTVPDLVQPEIAARAAPLGSDTIADPKLPAPAEAEQVDRAVKGVHALFREQRMPLTTTEESLATPPLTRREVALARVEQRAPREAVKNEAAAQMAAVEENAMAVIEPLAATMAATKTKTPKGQAKVAAKFAKAMRGVVQEAAKTGSIEAAQQYVTKNLPTALKGLGVTADAVDMTKAVNAGVGLARTQFSKGATEPQTSPRQSIQERLEAGRARRANDLIADYVASGERGSIYHVRSDGTSTRVTEGGTQFQRYPVRFVTENVANNLLGLRDNFPDSKFTVSFSGTSGTVSQDGVAAFEFQARPKPEIGLHPVEDGGSYGPHVGSKLKSVRREAAANDGTKSGDLKWEAAKFFHANKEYLTADEWKKVQAGMQSESRAALTQDEFEALSPAAKTAALDAYTQAMRAKGTALLARLLGLIGDRPELTVSTFAASPGGHIGSYTRVGPLKAVISMATNAKEGLSVADHEGYHFAEDWLLTGGEKKVVANALRDGKPLFEQLKQRLRQYDRENGTNLTDEVTGIPAEARAYTFEFWRRGEFKAEGALARAWQKIKQFFERVANAVKGLGFQSIEDVFVALAHGQMAQREMVAPEGRAAYESRAADYLQSPAFKKWFGDSKAVDAEGKPLVVYHGTNKEFHVFQTAAGARSKMVGDWDGVHFTNDRAQAQDIANSLVRREGGEPRVVAVYLRAENPALFGKFKTKEQAQAAGHDSRLTENNTGLQEWTVFEPTQIKSVNNIGTFDPNNPDIRFSGARGNSWYYSALTDAVAAMPTKQASAQGWRDQIKGLVAKGAVKQVELDAVGLNDWLDLQQGKVSRDQVMAFLGENGVQVREVVLGEPRSKATSPGLPSGYVVEETATAYHVTDPVSGLDVSIGKGGKVDSDASAREYATERFWQKTEALDDQARSQTREPKFSSYQLPGGENYRELLLTLPARIADPTGWSAKEVRAKSPITGKPEFEVSDAAGNSVGIIRTATTEADAIAVAVKTKVSLNETFRSSHFDQPNILAHIRFNERTDANGKRVLFIEEIQSDWAQKGRRVGFTDENAIKEAKAKAQAMRGEWEDANTKLDAAKVEVRKYAKAALAKMGLDSYQQIITAGAKRAELTLRFRDLQKEPAYARAIREEDRLNTIAGDLATRMGEYERGHGQDNTVPNAPFVSTNKFAVFKDGKEVTRTDKDGKEHQERYSSMKDAEAAAVKKGGEARDLGMQEDTQAWTALALKRMIRYAAENGFDRVAWTTGAQQAERYDLSKQVDYIDYIREGPDTFRMAIVGKNGEGINLPQETFTAKELEDYVGKGVAQQIVEGEGQPGGGRMTLRGPDLRIGGEGMKGYYDKIVPSVANEILRKLGGGKVGTIQLTTAGHEPGEGVYCNPGNPNEWHVDGSDETYRTEDAAEKALAATSGTLQPGFTITPALAEAAANGLPLFSKGAAEYQSVKATPGVDMARMAKLLGPQLYGNMADIGPVTIKEMFQNSFDALKGAINIGQQSDGRISIDLDRNARTITLTDNGTGMTPETINKAFLTLAGTAKETDRASGGLGIAKMLFLFGNDELQLRTVRNGVESTLNTSGAQLMASFSDPSKAPDIQTRASSAPSGTVVVVKVPETYHDEDSDTDKPVNFPSGYDAKYLLRESPLFEPIDVQIDGVPIEIGKNFPIDEYTVMTVAKFAWGKVRVLVAETEYPSSSNVSVLSNGLFQFGDRITKDPADSWSGSAPFKFFFNLEPDVKADAPNYPIALNRKGFSQSAQGDFKALMSYIGVLYANKKDEASSHSFGSLVQVAEDGSGLLRIDLSVPPAKTGTTLSINKGDKVEVRDGRLYVNNREMPELTKEKLKEMKRDPTQFRVDQGLLDPEALIIHDNVLLEGKPYLEEAAKEVGVAKLSGYLRGIGSVLKSVRDAVAREGGPDYADVMQVPVGVSVDTEYYGVNTSIPFKAMMVNPTLVRDSNPDTAPIRMVSTMIHELAHHKEKNHSETGFIPELQRLGVVLAMSGDTQRITADLRRVLEQYSDVLAYFTRTEKYGHLTNRGIRLDGNAEATGGEGVSGGFVSPSRTRGDGSNLPGVRLPTASRSGGIRSGNERRGAHEADAVTTLFSRAAVEMRNRMTAGELEAVQIGEQYARLVENAKAPSDLLTRLLGVAKDDIVGGIGRWWTNNVSTPNFISASSRGFKNVYQAFNTYSRYRKILGEQLVRERVPDWYRASDADRKAAFDVMLTRTLEKYSTSSQELADLLNTLTPAQRKLYDQATGMIAGVLRRQFDSQKESRRRQLGAEAYEKWLTGRQEQVTALVDQGYVPLRRYGDYSVEVYMEAPDGKRVKAGLEFFNSPSQAKTAALAYAKEIERSGVALKVEMGRRSKNERDTGVSLEQFLGTLRRQGIDISQAERERLVVAMTNADSLVRTQMMRREGLAGFSRDSMRVLHEFGVNTTSEIAYARFAPVLDAALDGAEVAADIDAVTSEPVITVGESFGRREDGVPHNLWEQDGPMSGFYRDRANAMADTTLVPDRQSEWATKMRTAGVMYFIGGSISGAAVNTLSIPMVLTPYLSTHTDYLNATMTSLKTWKDSWQHYNVLRDMDKMKNPDPETAARLDAAGIGKEMRAAIVAAADHIFDTEIHMMLGISQGSLYSRSRNVQRAAEVWMTPFRVAEQTNRLASFMAAYRIATTGGGVRQADGTFKKLSGQELFRFASETVDQTQNNYNVNNRPGIMNNPLGALMFQFKSFPLFIIEAAALMYKVSPKSAVYMLLGLTAMAGVQGLPFAEEILNLVDVISQQLFNSPFNSRRAMRNAIKSASDAIGAADLSDAVMRGVVNEITGIGVATRVSSGFIPGTRIGAADADKGRVLAEIAGAPFSMLHDALSNAGPLVSAAAGGDWRRAADALRAGGPIAARNLVKGAEQLSTGYASDSRGRKVVDVSTVDGILQLTGLSSAAVTKANDMESIIIQTKAFHTQVSQDLEARLVKAYRADDAEQVARILDLRAKWNAQNPMMPILSNPAATRRAIMLAGMPLNRREQILLGRRLGAEFADVTAQ